MFNLSSLLSFFYVLLSLIGTSICQCLFNTPINHPTLVPLPNQSELICHTNQASECYPRLFQPTEEFQVVKDDQEIPPGLHIRMDMTTGIKEARPNVPESYEEHSNLADWEKIYFEPTEVTPYVPLERAHRPDRYVEKEPEVEFRGFIGEPRVGTVYNQFEQNMEHLHGTLSRDPKLSPSPSFETLTDLCHSHEWGFRFAKDSHVVQIVIQVIHGVFKQPIATRSKATLLLATAIQNNPDALSAALSHFYNDEWPTGPLEAVILALMHDHTMPLLTRSIFLLSGLCQDQSQLLKFVNHGHLETLLRLFQDETLDEFEGAKLRGKIANFMVDYIVDTDWAALSMPAGTSGSTSAATVAEDSEPDSWELVEKTRLEVHPKNIESNLKRWQVALRNAMDRMDKFRNPHMKTAVESIGLAYEKLGQREAERKRRSQIRRGKA